jgi:UDPglucose 6-dehydrogenase
MRITIVGTGYVGLVTGAGFAEFGHHVTCVDVDAKRIEMLRRGEMPFHEPGLPELVRRNAMHGRLVFSTNLADAVPGSAAVFIAVGTPSRDDGSADLAYVLEAARAIGRALDGYAVIVTKSTVPVGTADKVRAAVAAETKHHFAVASNPEFLKEGDAVNDFLKPARVIVGADEPKAVELLRDLYRGIMRTTDRIQVMSVKSAELAKYAANAMLATRISFMNELAAVCEAVGADIESIRKGIGSDPRIGPKFLFAGAGYGGSCFGKDLRALAHLGRELDVPLQVVNAVDRANERQKKLLGERVVKHFNGQLSTKRIAIWGLAFKPETDDIREAPALSLIEQLLAAGATVIGYDPVAGPNVKAMFGDRIEIAADPYAAAQGVDALVLVTEWHELRQPDLDRLATTMRQKVLVDGRNVWPREDARAAGFTYYGIGRPDPGH